MLKHQPRVFQSHFEAEVWSYTG